MNAYGVTYIESWGEADQLCAYLAKHNYAWACMSDDMDMFVYGCPRIIRNVSLLNHTATVYDTSKILKELGITFAHFREIMIVSGTDYNASEDTSLYSTIEWFRHYLDSCDPPGQVPNPQGTVPNPVPNPQCIVPNPVPNPQGTFCDWLAEHTDYIRDRSKLNHVLTMFDLNVFAAKYVDELRKVVANVPFRNKLIQMRNLREIMEKSGFIFMFMSSYV